MAHEFELRGIKFQRQVPLPVVYKEKHLDQGYRMDFVIEDKVVVELKTAEMFAPVHETQVLTYLRFSSKRLGLLLNFNEKLLKNGLRRYAL